VPPLRYAEVYRLRRDFPELEIVLNGGVTTREQITAHLGHVDGVMLGRAAYHDPWVLAAPGVTRAAVVHAMHAYAQRQAARGVHLRHVARHMLGLYHGQPRARLWRRMLSDPALLSRGDPDLLLEAQQAVESAAEEEAPHERRIAA
jgi:tRNA-dihydrouridine synthase A